MLKVVRPLEHDFIELEFQIILKIFQKRLTFGACLMMSGNHFKKTQYMMPFSLSENKTHQQMLIKNNKTSIVELDSTIDEKQKQAFIEKKVAQATKTLKRVGLPKELTKKIS